MVGAGVCCKNIQKMCTFWVGDISKHTEDLREIGELRLLRSTKVQEKGSGMKVFNEKHQFGDCGTTSVPGSISAMFRSLSPA